MVTADRIHFSDFAPDELHMLPQPAVESARFDHPFILLEREISNGTHRTYPA
jgi:hypothetical protein